MARRKPARDADDDIIESRSLDERLADGFGMLSEEEQIGLWGLHEYADNDRDAAKLRRVRRRKASTLPSGQC